MYASATCLKGIISKYYPIIFLINWQLRSWLQLPSRYGELFLSDLTGDYVDQLADVNKFLQSLIAHNTIAYQTDWNAREWSFKYYLDNANYRLINIAEKLFPEILPKSALDTKAGAEKDEWTEKDQWEVAQAALDLAITNFKTKIGANPQISS